VINIGMPPKRQSKRKSLHHQHKVKKKVAEHHRQQRRDARKNALTHKPKKKDPGIPNIYPFKEQLMAKAEAHRQKLDDEKQRQKDDRAALRKKLREGAGDSMSALVADAAKRAKTFEKDEQMSIEEKEQKAQMYNLKDGSKRAYFKEFKKIVEMSDVILEVLDARDPLGCRCPDVEQKIVAKHPNKKIIFILNKIDLVPQENVEPWLKYLRNEFPAIAFKCSTQEQRKNLGRNDKKKSEAGGLSTVQLLEKSECLGADTLLQLLKNYSRNSGMKTALSVGIIGYPNVGKSSLINSLKRTRSVGVGSTPGFTKVVQEIQLDKSIKLIDSPGIVFSTKNSSDSDIILRNAIKVSQVVDPIAPVEAIMRKCQREQLMAVYKLSEYNDTTGFLIQIATNRGKLKKGGAPNILQAAKSVLQDWNEGRIRFFSIPPERKDVHISAEIVQTYGKAFDLHSILDTEQNMISSLDDKFSRKKNNFMEMTSSEAQDSAYDLDADDLSEEENDLEHFSAEDEEESEDGEEEGEEGEEEVEEGEEEEMENDEEEGDDMEEEEEEEAPVAIPIAARQKQKLRDEADKHNPQLNKARKQKQKKDKKKDKKVVGAGGDDTYDFSTDFYGGEGSDLDLDD